MRCPDAVLSPPQINRLQDEMGPSLMVIANSSCGHYNLDLSTELDRFTALRLAALNAVERDYVLANKPASWDKHHGGTAQKLRWNNFRNERFRAAPLTEGLSDEFFLRALKDKIPGIMDFDYVSTLRMPLMVEPVSNIELNNLLSEIGLKRVSPNRLDGSEWGCWGLILMVGMAWHGERLKVTENPCAKRVMAGHVKVA
jgi:hypothetical protein